MDQDETPEWGEETTISGNSTDSGNSGSGGVGTSVAVPVLPMPAKLEQKRTSRSLMSAVRGYFYPAYNNNPRFQRYLASVGNDDSQTKNRLFDRHFAVMIIQKMAQDAKDRMTAEAPHGHVYGCLVTIMRSENLGLKLRREQYKKLTHQAQAAD